MNDSFRHCAETPDVSSSGTWTEGERKRWEQDRQEWWAILHRFFPDYPLPIDIDKLVSGVVSLQGAEENSGRADVPLVGTDPQSDENPGNKPHEDLGASEGI